MPSLIRSWPTPYYVPLSHNGIPGTIVDVEEKKRSNRDSGRFSVRSSRSSKSSQESLSSSAGSLRVEIESPPVVCYGPANESSGALLSGMLWLTVAPWEIELESLKLVFQSTTTTKKPVVLGCQACSSSTTDLNTWEFIAGSHALPHGQHSYPFSYLLPGNTPATTNSVLGSIKYQLHGRGVTVQGEVLQFTQEIKVSRALLSNNDRNSLRIFPPTNLSATLTLPSVIHRGGTFPVEMRLDGVVNSSNQTRWKLRKACWRMEEKSKIISPACKQHGHKLGGQGKGVQYEDIKVISTEEYKNGWKTDFSGSDGKIEFQFNAGIPAYAMSTDDVDNKTGLTVTHHLVLELIVAEEHWTKNSKMVTPTGSARVLRMQFNMNTSARPGMGISWEDECPPRYDDIPSSPPTYDTLVGMSSSVEDLTEL